MVYVESAVGSSLIPKILGTYEFELIPIVESIVQSAPKNIFNLGAGEGYYTVGLARLLSRSRFFAWELAREGQSLITILLGRNGIDSAQVEVNGFCSVSELKGRLEQVDHSSGSLVMADVEGAEALLLDPVIIPELFEIDMLVEVHESMVPGVGVLLRARFEETHSIREVTAKRRALSDWPSHVCADLGPLWNGAKLALMDERRPTDMSWLHLQCKVRH